MHTNASKHYPENIITKMSLTSSIQKDISHNNIKSRHTEKHNMMKKMKNTSCQFTSPPFSFEMTG